MKAYEAPGRIDIKMSEDDDLIVVIDQNSQDLQVVIRYLYGKMYVNLYDANTHAPRYSWDREGGMIDHATS